MEAGFGTGRARLEILSGHDILEVPMVPFSPAPPNWRFQPGLRPLADLWQHGTTLRASQTLKNFFGELHQKDSKSDIMLEQFLFLSIFLLDMKLCIIFVLRLCGLARPATHPEQTMFNVGICFPGVKALGKILGGPTTVELGYAWISKYVRTILVMEKTVKSLDSDSANHFMS